jgi:hypothetical protein
MNGQYMNGQHDVIGQHGIYGNNTDQVWICLPWLVNARNLNTRWLVPLETAVNGLNELIT